MYSVLCVDDDPDFLEIAKIFLERSGQIRIDTVVSASQAIEQLETTRFDAIVSDYQMPGTDGIEFLRYIRARDSEIPFILFTGKGREEVVIEALNSGADFYLQKGSDPDSQFAELEHKIRLAVEQRQNRKELLESQQMTSTIIDHLPDATFAVDLDGKVIAWNHAMEEMTGIKKEDILGTGDYSYSLALCGKRKPVLLDRIIRPDERLEQTFPPVERKGDRLISEIFSPHLYGGDEAYLWFIASPLYDTKGMVIGAIESIRNITDRKHAENELARRNEELHAAYEELTATNEELRQNYDELSRAERNQRESESRYRTIFENTGTAMVVIEEDTTISLANTEFERLSGYSGQEIEGKMSWTGFVIKEDLDRMLNQHRLRREDQNAALKHYEFRFSTRSGEIRTILLTIDVIPGSKRSIASLMDITDKIWSEEALRKNEERFRHISELITDFAYSCRKVPGDPFVIDWMTGAVEKITGYTAEEVRAMTCWRELVLEEDRPLFDRNVIGLAPGMSARSEIRIVRKDGEIIWLASFAQCMIDPEDSSCHRLYGGCRDITGRKGAERALADEATKRKILVEQSRDGIVILDQNGRVYESNRQFADMLGYSPDEMRELHVWDWDAHIERAQLGEMIRTIDEAGDHFETQHRRRDGTVLDVEISTNASVFGGEKLIFCVVRDITERKRTEEQIRRFNEELELKIAERTRDLSNLLTERELLLREIHHRVKNNLQIVASLFKLQSRYIKDEKILEAVHESQNRVRAMALVHERIYREEKLSSISVKEYLHYLGDQLFRFYGITPSRISFVLDSPEIQLDIDTAIPLGLIMNELLSNSLKHAFPGGRTGTITLRVTGDEHTLVFLVSDDGVGMPGELDWKNAVSLGLRLVISLVEQLEGTIEREPTGSGTAFRIVVKQRQRNKEDRPASDNP